MYLFCLGAFWCSLYLVYLFGCALYTYTSIHLDIMIFLIRTYGRQLVTLTRQ